jgi:hypothetical protein
MARVPRARCGPGEGAAGDPFLQGLALVAGHGEEQLAVVGLADVVDGADVGVFEGQGRRGLVDEALLGLVAGGQSRGQEPEGDGAAEARVLRAVDDAHAPFASFSVILQWDTVWPITCRSPLSHPNRHIDFRVS